MEWNKFVTFFIYGALILAGIRVIIYFVRQFKGEAKEKETPGKYLKKPNILYYLLCVIYIITLGICAFYVNKNNINTAFIMCVVAVIGCILLLARKYFGIFVALAASLLCIIVLAINNVFDGAYLNMATGKWIPSFETETFVIILLLTFLPGLLLLPIVIIIMKSKRGDSDKTTKSD